MNGHDGAGAPVDTDDTVPGPAGVGPTPGDSAPEPSTDGRPRHPFYLRGRRPRLPRSRRGLFALLLILAGLGGVAAFSGVSLIHWTETADFCGRCHTMEPELQAYEAGPHREVSCGECHVEPGIAGWIKAKVNGSRQLAQIILGTYPAPIPPPEHSHLPSARDTCMRCHDVTREELADLRTRTTFTEDEANTRQFVGLLIRPGGGDLFNIDRGVHWHAVREVVYATADEDASSIDYVAATAEDGTIREFIAQDKIRVVDDVRADIDRILAADKSVTMGCYDCHNRVGHSIPNPRTGLDYKLSTGAIDASLPYVKREGMRVLWASYPDEEAADAAADALADFYRLEYPRVYGTKREAIETAIEEIKVLYRLTATPEMKVTAQTYPDHKGHTDFAGCFRCHDGGHFLVEDGVVTKETIPSACNTCHTFPQIGPAVASLPLGEPPDTHKEDSLWVFSHKDVTTELDPGGTSCGECHARDYCVNCHSTGAVTVDHETMSTNHAKVIREQGNNACAYCHQPVYCARCHNEKVLPVTTPFSHGPEANGVEDLPSGVSWPLTPRT